MVLRYRRGQRTGQLTIDWRLARQNDHHQLQALIGVLEVLEHGLHAVGSLGVLAEAGLSLDGHASVFRDLPQLVCEAPGVSKIKIKTFYKTEHHNMFSQTLLNSSIVSQRSENAFVVVIIENHTKQKKNKGKHLKQTGLQLATSSGKEKKRGKDD